jgi:hypothetical protein
MVLVSGCIDLDDPSLNLAALEIWAPDSGKTTSHKMAELFLKLVLKQALADSAIALNMFYDNEDNCLRIVEYFLPGNVSFREMAPAPGYFAEQALRELRKFINVKSTPSNGCLTMQYNGVVMNAYAEAPNNSEVRVFWTAERPNMLTRP